MKILSAEKTKELDQYTIEHEPVKSIDLMERAARSCVSRLLKLADINSEFWIVCGKGNNGGDGLAIARLLSIQGFTVKAIIVDYKKTFSEDAQTNFNQLKEKFPIRIHEIHSLEEFKQLISGEKNNTDVLIVDALVGTGINKPVEGLLEEVIQIINDNFSKIISIDVPSGLYVDKSSSENKTIIQSSLTLTFQFPKISFLFAENKKYVPEFEILDIGLSRAGIELQASNFYYITRQEISSLLKPRSKFSHKGTFGHALLLAGSIGKSGAGLIASRACLRSGAGLLTLHSNKETVTALLTHLPEAMSSVDPNLAFISEIDKPELFDAIAFGPGTGTHIDTQTAFKKILQYYTGKLIVDADGLNILSENKTWLNFLQPGTILTPHPKEFERLTEKHTDDFERLKAAKHFSLKYNCILILKSAHTAICMPDGNVFFNSSGNPGLAKGGSGDALTGIILGLLARGYNAPQSALIGTFIHGYAADLCVKKKSAESLLISDVIEMLPRAFKKLED
ncbi:NAD(P)H-hydrate dehydratase [Aurantibacillus circumpalustris]|uniref:NAD(P)H-hydrate dehydratase n=1 Tax=Aurantibacillus circumpalustris TaxID=3036359 RepID=UPI00295A56FB|nr:NAD(P)H-hydrate dehydratase [Aurantibacillus circumpalustris]